MTNSRKRLDQVIALGKSKTAANSFVLFGGNMAGAALSVITTIIISRKLGPANYGVLGVFLALVTMIVGLTDFGLSTTAIKLISQYLDKDKRKAAVTMRVIFKLELISGLVVGLTGLIFSIQIADLLGGQQLLLAVRLAFLAGAFSSAAAFVSPFLNAHGKFFKNASFGFLNAVFKLTGVALLLGLAAINLTNILGLYTAMAIVFFFVALVFSPKGYLTKISKQENRESLHEVFHFSKWILLSYIATVVAGRLDIFLLSRFKGTETVGLYAAAQQLVSPLPLLIGAITSVLLPQVSRLVKPHEFRSYIKRVVAGGLGLIVLFIPVLIFSAPLIHAVFGSKYSGSLGAFQLLFSAYLLSLLINPISLIIYAKNKPKILTAINLIQLAITVTLDLLFIPQFGLMGAALTFLGVTAISGIATIVFSVRLAGQKSVDELPAT
jgi:O-antigen/teichoic acid export membrane protein